MSPTLEAAITPQTQLVAVSAIQFFSGARADLVGLGEICQKHNILFVVDAIQAIGHMLIDVQAMHIDILASGGQKSLMSAPGTGFLYVRNNVAENLQPRSIGPNATVDFLHWLDYDITPRPGAKRFMMGTLNYTGMATALASIGLFEELTREAIDAHTSGLAAYAIDALQSRGFSIITPAECHGPIVTFVYDDSTEITNQFMARLSENNITVTTHKDRASKPYVRISIHCYNVEDDIIKFLNFL